MARPRIESNDHEVGGKSCRKSDFESASSSILN